MWLDRVTGQRGTPQGHAVQQNSKTPVDMGCFGATTPPDATSKLRSCGQLPLILKRDRHAAVSRLRTDLARQKTVKNGPYTLKTV